MHKLKQKLISRQGLPWGDRVRSIRWMSVLGACLLLLAPNPCHAQKEGEEELSGPVITLHGFLTQAYAATDGNQFVGITEDGTFDYRSAAIQIRADTTPQDSFVIQLAHERLGESPVMAFRDEVEIDWVFYEHRFESSAIKVGRVQVPFGIFSEVRDVGTILPFYRPSGLFYGEGSFDAETVDGILLSHRRRWGDWALEGDLHYGSWEFLASDTEYFRIRADDSLGIELWLDTPVPGLRVGAGTMRYEVDSVRLPPAQGSNWQASHASISWELDRFAAHAEYGYWNYGGGASYETAYLHLGYALTDRIVVNGQIETADWTNGDFEGDFDDERILGLSYQFRHDLVLKAEHHWNEGFSAENPIPDFFGPEVETRTWISSLSVSF